MQARTAAKQVASEATAAAAAAAAATITSRLSSCEAHHETAPSVKPLQLQVASFSLRVYTTNGALQGWSFKRFVSLDSVAGAHPSPLALQAPYHAACQATTDIALLAMSLRALQIEAERVCGGLRHSTWSLPARAPRLRPAAAACRLYSTAIRLHLRAPAVLSLLSHTAHLMR